jgi:hypothetical protein
VVADIAKLSVGREAYYTRELATDHHQQYLSGHGESPGRWYGAGATSLGLQGEAWVTRPLAGRCSKRITAGWSRRSPTWTDTLALVADTADTSMCPDRVCWPSASTTGHRGRATRCCTPTS